MAVTVDQGFFSSLSFSCIFLIYISTVSHYNKKQVT